MLNDRIIAIRVRPEEHAALHNAARRDGRSVTSIIREQLADFIGRPRAVALRQWFLDASIRQNEAEETRLVASLEERRALRIAAKSASLRRLVDIEIRLEESRLAQCRGVLEEFRRERSALVAPALAVAAIDANIGLALAVGIVVLAAGVYWVRRGRARKFAFRAKRHVQALVDDDETEEEEPQFIARGVDKGAPKRTFRQSPNAREWQDVLQEFYTDPRYLRDALHHFVNRPDGIEFLRQFCEENDIEAPEEGRGTPQRVFLLPCTEDQLANVPAEVRTQLLSRRSSQRLVVNVQVAPPPAPTLARGRVRPGAPPMEFRPPPINHDSGGDQA